MTSKVFVRIKTYGQWYAVMAECRRLYGQEWRCQPRFKRKLDRMMYLRDHPQGLYTWFRVPDHRFAVWIATKLGIDAVLKDRWPSNK